MIDSEVFDKGIDFTECGINLWAGLWSWAILEHALPERIIDDVYPNPGRNGRLIQIKQTLHQVLPRYLVITFSNRPNQHV
jgi:hypothetical protein